MFIQATLDDFRAVFKVLAQLFFRHAQKLNFHVLAKIRFINQRLHAAPQALNRLKLFMVHNGVKLAAYLVIELSDVVIDQAFIQFFDFRACLGQAFQKDLHTRGQTLVSGRIGHRLCILPDVQRTQLGDRIQIDFLKQ